jgi:hypothetical protein
MKKLIAIALMCFSTLSFGYGDVGKQVEFDLIRSLDNMRAVDSCNRITESMYWTIHYSLAGIPFAFKDITSVPSYNKYNIVNNVPIDAIYMQIWDKFTPESKLYFIELMRPAYDYAHAEQLKNPEIGEDFFDAWINSEKAKCMSERLLKERNKKPESQT